MANDGDWEEELLLLLLRGKREREEKKERKRIASSAHSFCIHFLLLKRTQEKYCKVEEEPEIA